MNACKALFQFLAVSFIKFCVHADDEDGYVLKLEHAFGKGRICAVSYHARPTFILLLKNYILALLAYCVLTFFGVNNIFQPRR